jgi:hypothetical protein
VELAVEIIGTDISANKCVLAAVGVPVFTALKNTLKVVATELTAAAEATGMNLTLWTKLPFKPAVNAKNWSVPIAFTAEPSERTKADVVVIFTSPIFGVNE